MNTLRVELGTRGYPIHIGRGLLDRGTLIDALIDGREVVVITDDNVAPLYLQRVRDSLLRRPDAAAVILPAGERHKTLASLEHILDRMLELALGRDAVVIALGGGVVGDVAGFAAACYQRGVALVQIPTSLLAQVDSAVGGKTAVNHPRGKNMIGVFHQPCCVIADSDALTTLAPRELRAGVAEVIKYALIGDPEFFAWLERHVEEVLALDPEALAYAVHRSCADKAAIVADDEREAGCRALLNLGHSFGHAIETGLGYGAWLHGEAVAAGMCLAADLSHRIGWLEPAAVARIRTLIERCGLPTGAPVRLAGTHVRELMSRDKKVLGGRLRLVLLEDIGRAVISDSYGEDALESTLRDAPAAASDPGQHSGEPTNSPPRAISGARSL